MNLQEYDIEIKLVNIVHGNRLCKLFVKAKDNKNEC